MALPGLRSRGKALCYIQKGSTLVHARKQEDESPQSSSAGSTPGRPPQGPPPGPDGHGSDSTDPPPKDGGRNFSRTAAIVAAGVTTGAVAVGAAPVVLGAMGFTGAGIAASSLAAKMMSAAAVANGGGVAAGSLVATLQSAGKCPGQEGAGVTRARTRLSPEAKPEGGSVLSLHFCRPQPLPHCPLFWLGAGVVGPEVRPGGLHSQSTQ
ncbi:hypothetical protein mRhiFer1_010101 [Rhinolophus ferrumequinum]|uniref:Interferon alpha inducible protein 27 like 2 n=1 Tax=Rhinolophus ferrumequinum TaxID=59479 RepID=A0A7J7XPK9_RHIFE|nr:hypothetical protein mRhiFer1_010101 [Rhinolophus ferrumequinum]